MYVDPAPDPEQIIGRLGFDRLMAAINGPATEEPGNRYLHWDKLRRLTPPAGLSNEQWWLKLRLARREVSRSLPLVDEHGNAFGYTLPDLVHRSLHHIDQRGGGEVAMDEVVTSEREAGRRFLVNSLMEEAIRSSQLEGATTSRIIAKDLLRSGREPRDRSELMIANNYRALRLTKEMGGELTPEAVLESAPGRHRGDARQPFRGGAPAATGRGSGSGLRSRRGSEADPRPAAGGTAAGTPRSSLRLRQCRR